LGSQKYTPILVIVLALGLLGSIYLYADAKAELAANMVETHRLQTDFSQLTSNYDQLSAQIETLQDSNTELEARIAELESTPNDTTPPPEVVVERNEVNLNISGSGTIRNVIFLIGDGMGVGQLSAAEYVNGQESLSISSMPYKSLVTTYSESAFVTDSAASGTALATGYKTNNGRISLSTSGETLTTVVEVAEENGASTGIVSNTRVTHATPACFMAHVSSRGMESAIASQILDSGVDVVLGGGSTYFDSLDTSGAGYTVVTTTDELHDFDSGKVLGLFAPGYMSYDDYRDPDVEPSLAEMTDKSIELLSHDPDGFFLMVEGGRIDHASHDNDFDATMSEVFAFDEAVLVALEYASSRNDTLVLVTADHETGGLMIVGGYDYTGLSYKWISDDHTGSMVPVYAYGPRAEEAMAFTDNTDIGRFLIELFQ